MPKIQTLSQLQLDLLSPKPSKRLHNWSFDRLRSRKGFPTGDDIDLGTFLRNNAQHSLAPRPDNPTRSRSLETHDPPLTTVLAQLFTGKTLTRRKWPRKQPRPKIYITPSSPTVTAATVVEEQDEEGGEEEETVDLADDVENDDGDDWKGFSRSEVTVIDTSSSGWKADKFLFRNGNVWKLTDWKPRSRSFSKKKTDDTVMANGDDDDDDDDDDINGIGT